MSELRNLVQLTTKQAFMIWKDELGGSHSGQAEAVFSKKTNISMARLKELFATTKILTTEERSRIAKIVNRPISGIK